jgi:tRNA threonylcarbamoyl adenosine modification protein (Sua5/YciO/YrdC/YwlC family)
MLIFNSINDPKLIESLKSGAVGVMPSDTLYGLMCCADKPEAVERLYQIKPRVLKPGTLIAASIDQLVELGIPRRYVTAVEQFWPNPISVVVPTTPAMKYLDHGQMSLAVRIPADEKLRELLEKTGPLQTTSANLPDEPPATDCAEAMSYFGEMVDFYVDAGKIDGFPPSTIIRVVDDAVVVIREGAVKINEKGEIVG